MAVRDQGVFTTDAKAGNQVYENTGNFDPGGDWTQQESCRSASLWDVDFTDLTHGWVVGEQATVLATTDAGETWVSRYDIAPADLFAVTLFDGETGWIGGDGGADRKTTDGGEYVRRMLREKARTVGAAGARRPGRPVPDRVLTIVPSGGVSEALSNRRPDDGVEVIPTVVGSAWRPASVEGGWDESRRSRPVRPR
jgi:photosystem II stability/assembly factor-like uncharacterized protein